MPGVQIELYVQSKFKSAAGGVTEVIAAHARAFQSILQTIMHSVLERDPALLRIFYIVTLRADDSVCSYSKQDKKVWANALAFQQNQTFDVNTGKLAPGCTKRVYTYWPVDHSLYIKMACKQHLDSRCVLLSEPSTFRAGVPNQNASPNPA